MLFSVKDRNYIAKGILDHTPIPKGMDKGKACAYYSFYSAYVFRRMGYSANLIAGSATFEAVPPQLDDGVSPTHYSYVYTPVSRIRWMQVPLPEVHCWCVVTNGQDMELLDFTVSHLPRLSQSIGLKWRAPLPPNYLWTNVTTIPRGWVYEMAEDATVVMRNLMQQAFGEMFRG